MPKSWSEKDERQYEEIKKSASNKHSAKRAKQIAAATVNKRRSEEGRTKEQRESRGAGGRTASRRTGRGRTRASS